MKLYDEKAAGRLTGGLGFITLEIYANKYSNNKPNVLTIKHKMTVDAFGQVSFLRNCQQDVIG